MSRCTGAAVATTVPVITISAICIVNGISDQKPLPQAIGDAARGRATRREPGDHHDDRREQREDEGVGQPAFAQVGEPERHPLERAGVVPLSCHAGARVVEPAGGIHPSFTRATMMPHWLLIVLIRSARGRGEISTGEPVSGACSRCSSPFFQIAKPVCDTSSPATVLDRRDDVAVADAIHHTGDRLLRNDKAHRPGIEPALHLLDGDEGAAVLEGRVGPGVTGHERDGSQVGHAAELGGDHGDMTRTGIGGEPVREVVQPAGVARDGPGPIADVAEVALVSCPRGQRVAQCRHAVLPHELRQRQHRLHERDAVELVQVDDQALGPGTSSVAAR